MLQIPLIKQESQSKHHSRGVDLPNHFRPQQLHRPLKAPCQARPYLMTVACKQVLGVRRVLCGLNGGALASWCRSISLQQQQTCACTMLKIPPHRGRIATQKRSCSLHSELLHSHHKHQHPGESTVQNRGNQMPCPFLNIILRCGSGTVQEMKQIQSILNKYAKCCKTHPHREPSILCIHVPESNWRAPGSQCAIIQEGRGSVLE